MLHQTWKTDKASLFRVSGFRVYSFRGQGLGFRISELWVLLGSTLSGSSCLGTKKSTSLFSGA